MARPRTKQPAEDIASPEPANWTVSSNVDELMPLPEVVGVSLRDRFALAAIQGLLSSPSGYRGTTPETWKLYARDAYNIADAMIAQRVDTTK
jgi:hypothetical protein